MRGSGRLAIASATAQVNKGTITGIVKDSSGAVLPGAKIELQPSGRTAVSDAQGQFLIPNMSAGSYTLTISYVGFSPTSLSVAVVPGVLVRADAMLQVKEEHET